FGLGFFALCFDRRRGQLLCGFLCRGVGSGCNGCSAMENELAELSLEDGEEEILLLPNESKSQKAVYDFCLVGCFLTASVVHFPVMRSTIANIWHPWRGVHISNLGEK
ncbi:hypothetical protein Golob_012837, partial [Gossypium lobatum]|nr:hypothetical protein [Gossypium lobatum]